MLTTERVKKLVADWRSRAQQERETITVREGFGTVVWSEPEERGAIYDYCADELEKLLRESEDKDE